MKNLVAFAFSTALLTGCGGGDGTSPTSPSPTPVPSPPSNDFQWTGQIGLGNRIEIKGVNGGIRATATTGDLTQVSATKRAQRNDPSQVTVELVEHSDGVTICAVYPAPPGEPANECLPGDAGRMSVRDNDVAVDFDILLPAGVVLVGRTVNGGVEATNVASDVVAGTTNGEIVISTSRHAEASGVNGRVSANIGLATWDRDLEIGTVNGTVTVEIPSNTNGRVRASTVNGVVRSDFPLTSSSPRSAQGTLGSGGRLLTLSTVNGNVNLNRGPASGR